MNIHEYQAKRLLEKYGIPIPAFEIAGNVSEVKEAIKKMSLQEGVVKVQIHAGGRGKAGGVKLAKTPEEILKVSEELIGKKIVNQQTGPLGLVSEKVMISAPVSIKQEFYLAALIDRKLGMGVILASREGGVEIEEKPESIHKEVIGLNGKLMGFQLLTIAKFLGWQGDVQKQGIKLVAALAKAFAETDASLFEINPLVETTEGKLIALDAKAAIDDNALFRQKEIASWIDLSQLPKNEVMAREHDLAYVGLTGEIGCMVNGAGLAMATMDIIQMHGGQPANFLDVGGSATKEKIAHGFKIILFDPNVKAIFVNIFGGIMDCAVLAMGLVEATKEDGVRVPLVVRMEGTNEDKGKQILKESKLNILTAQTMEEGAKLVVKAARGS